jgi:hypothetical protein
LIPGGSSCSEFETAPFRCENSSFSRESPSFALEPTCSELESDPFQYDPAIFAMEDSRFDPFEWIFDSIQAT